MTLALDRTREVLFDAVANRVFPGAVVEVGGVARAAATLAVGTLGYEEGSDAVSASTIFDLASLTKVLSTATLAATLVEQRHDRARRSVTQVVDGMAGRGSSRRDHSPSAAACVGAAGAPPLLRDDQRWAGLRSCHCSEPLEYVPGEASVYSDPGFILLGRVLERAAGADLDAQFDAWRRSTWTAEPAIRFRPPAAWLPRIAPTEDDPWRGRVLRGEVHDENAAALDGVAGHAGLFGTAAAVGDCARWWMARASREPWATFLARGDVPGSSRASAGTRCGRPRHAVRGCHRPPRGTPASPGRRCGSTASNDRYVVFLSNRVHPSRAGDAMARVRPALHDAVAGDLTRG